MKCIILSIATSLLFLFQLSVQEQSIIPQLEKELTELDSSGFCEKAILLSDLYFATKRFAKADEYADAAYRKANLIGRKNLMATALNSQAKSKLKNKREINMYFVEK